MQEKDISLSRYAAVSFIEQLLSEGKSLNYALCLAAERCWGLRCYSASTLEKWYYRYRLEGFEALKPKGRKDKGVRKCLSTDQKEALRQLRQKHPELTVKSLLRRLKAQGILNPGNVSLSSIYRYLRDCGLDRQSLKATVAVPRGPTKAFEFARANELWMTDAMHGIWLKPANGGKARRTHLLALIDDCSRLVTHAQYYNSERLDCFVDTLKQAILRRGIPEQLYTDRGKIFTSDYVRELSGHLGIRLTHAKPYHCWSKGKIEKFFQTLQRDFEQSLLFEKVSELDALNERLWKWLEQDYHQRVHSALGGQSPAHRFHSTSQRLRIIEDTEKLDRLFLKRLQRRVRKDSTLSLEGCLWEVPPHLRGMRVEVHYDPFTLTAAPYIYYKGHLIGRAEPCDKVLNAHHFSSNNYEQPLSE